MSHSIKISDIEEVNIVIKDSKLQALERGGTPSSPVVLLDRGFSKPYRIIDGHHRVYLACKNNCATIEAEFIDEQ